jgi:hypothetical protein
VGGRVVDSEAGEVEFLGVADLVFENHGAQDSQPSRDEESASPGQRPAEAWGASHWRYDDGDSSNLPSGKQQ